MMTSKPDKFQKWLKKAQYGEAGFELIWWNNQPENGTWLYRSEDYCKPITSLTVLAWDEDKHYLSYEWNTNDSPADNKFIIIIKDSKKVLISNKDEIFDFGLEKDFNKMNFLLFHQCDSLGTIVAASMDIAGVAKTFYSYESCDVIQNVIGKRINMNVIEKRIVKEEIKHGNSNEQAATGIVDE